MSQRYTNTFPFLALSLFLSKSYAYAKRDHKSITIFEDRRGGARCKASPLGVFFLQLLKSTIYAASSFVL